MTTLEHADMFFFISSIGFTVIAIIIVIALIYITLAIKAFTRLIDKIEASIDSLSDTTQELIEEMRNSIIFRLLAGKRKKQYEKK